MADIHRHGNQGQEGTRAATEASDLTFDGHQPFDGVVVHVDVMRLLWSSVVSRCKVRPGDSRSATCTKLK